MSSSLSNLLHTASLVVVSLLVGAMFGIWRGYDPILYSPATFVEVHRGAVQGLNLLLPAMGLAAIAMTAGLAFLARKRRPVVWLYVAAAAALAIAGIVTRLGNQPLNDVVMGWGATPPEGWETLRDTWWNWHLVRLAAGFAGEVLLINPTCPARGPRAATPSPHPAGVVATPAYTPRQPARPSWPRWLGKSQQHGGLADVRA